MTALGRVVTFYSFKGGVGRSMALANVAWRLAERHAQRVVVVDWDLEAPGLHRFLGLQDADSMRPPRGGVLELLRDWQLADDASAAAPPAVTDYLYSIPRDDNAGGSLELMFAGRLDESFPDRLQALDLDSFYECDHGGAAIEWLRTQLCQRADVVLVDSRTGLNEIGGICTIQMPDGVFFMTAPNEQGFQGVSRVARAVHLAPPDERGGRSPPTNWLVVTRMPIIDDPGGVKAWWADHEKQFDLDRLDGVWTPVQHRSTPGISSHSIPYVPRWSLGEPLLFKQTTIGTYDPLARAYEHLAATLFSWMHPRTVELTAQESIEDREVVMRRDAVTAARTRQDLPGLSVALYDLGVALRRAGRLEDAAEAFAEAAGADLNEGDKDGRAASLQALAMTRTDQGRYEEALEALESAKAEAEALGDPERIAAVLGTSGVWKSRRGQVTEAIADLSRALDLQRNHGLRRGAAVTLDLLGNTYLDLGQLDPAEQSFREAAELYRLENEPRGLAASIIGLGNVALQRKHWVAALDLFQQARDRLSQVAGLPPARLLHALHGVGQAFQQLGRTDEARGAFRDAANISRQRGDRASELGSWRAAARLGDEEAIQRVKELEPGEPRRWVATLTPEELEDLSRPVVGQGGFQSLLRELQSRIHGDQLIVDEQMHERMDRSATKYGEGGFQRRLRELLARLQEERSG